MVGAVRLGSKMTLVNDVNLMFLDHMISKERIHIMWIIWCMAGVEAKQSIHIPPHTIPDKEPLKTKHTCKQPCHSQQDRTP